MGCLGGIDEAVFVGRPVSDKFSCPLSHGFENRVRKHEMYFHGSSCDRWVVDFTGPQENFNYSSLRILKTVAE